VEAEEVFLEDIEVVKLLRAKGHWFKLHKPFGNAQVIFFDSKTNTLIGVSDPRGDGEARGY
jgi:gamma-glutamyltranspeptidase